MPNRPVWHTSDKSFLEGSMNTKAASDYDFVLPDDLQEDLKGELTDHLREVLEKDICGNKVSDVNILIGQNQSKILEQYYQDMKAVAKYLRVKRSGKRGRLFSMSTTKDERRVIRRKVFFVELLQIIPCQ